MSLFFLSSGDASRSCPCSSRGQRPRSPGPGPAGDPRRASPNASGDSGPLPGSECSRCGSHCLPGLTARIVRGEEPFPCQEFHRRSPTRERRGAKPGLNAVMIASGCREGPAPAGDTVIRCLCVGSGTAGWHCVPDMESEADQAGRVGRPIARFSRGWAVPEIDSHGFECERTDKLQRGLPYWAVLPCSLTRFFTFTPRLSG